MDHRPSQKYHERSSRLAVTTDITEKKRAEDALKQSEERLRVIIANIKDYSVITSVITLDSEGLVNSWIGAALRITGNRTEEVWGKYASILYPPDAATIGKPTTKLATAIKEGRFEDDGWRVRKDGSQFWANAVVTPLLDEAGVLSRLPATPPRREMQNRNC